ncbi:MAG: hypothetical protein GY714_12005 [Desulfobacterales bacterium]|nr:hypothetical protein [Desulfobacterales bacterium]
MIRRRNNEFHAFSDYDGFSIIESQKQRIVSAIRSQTDDYILNVNREEYIQHLISEFSIIPLEINKDQLSVSTYEAQIPAGSHPGTYHVRSGQSYSKDVIKYHLPFTGDPELLKVRASSYTLTSPIINVEEGCICFEIVNFNLAPERIKQEADSTINSIESQNSRLTKDLIAFNNQIEGIANQAFDSRKQQLLSKNDLMSSLGVPVRKADDTPSTFSVPTRRTKVIPSKSKPVVAEKGYKPEPSIDDSIYLQILSIIHDVGNQFERLPSTYAGKDEESLRDHILLILEPNFEGSATGETFNKSGKTDILLRHEGKNVFIAELKFWRGRKSYLDTINQLLGYLTWRDSKAAIVMFVKNKELSPVLDIVKSATPEHENYLGFVSEQEEGWCHYRFHINDDKNREVKLSVMLFHLPE